MPGIAPKSNNSNGNNNDRRHRWPLQPYPTPLGPMLNKFPANVEEAMTGAEQRDPALRRGARSIQPPVPLVDAATTVVPTDTLPNVTPEPNAPTGGQHVTSAEQRMLRTVRSPSIPAARCGHGSRLLSRIVGMRELHPSSDSASAAVSSPTVIHVLPTLPNHTTSTVAEPQLMAPVSDTARPNNTEETVRVTAAPAAAKGTGIVTDPFSSPIPLSQQQPQQQLLPHSPTSLSRWHSGRAVLSCRRNCDAPSGYRPTAEQFLRAVQRMNRMIDITCNAGERSMMEFVDAQANRWNVNPWKLGAAGAANNIGRAGMTKSAVARGVGVGGVRQLTRVPLLPIGVCTDGTTVLLIDFNGTARHGNYVAAMRTYMRQRGGANTNAVGMTTTAAAAATTSISANVADMNQSNGNADSHVNADVGDSDAAKAQITSPKLGTVPAPLPVPSRVYWYTMEEVKRRKGFLPLANAEAVDKAVTQHSLVVSTDAPLSLVNARSNLLNLHYGEGLVLIITEADVTIWPAKRSNEGNEVSLDVTVGVGVGVEARDYLHSKLQPPSLGYSILRDLCQGYLPTFLESVYPNGGVQLRGCWCDASRAHGADMHDKRRNLRSLAVPLTTLRNGINANLKGAGKNADDNGSNDSAKMMVVANPLVHVSFPFPTAEADITDSAYTVSPCKEYNAASSRIMQSLRPTSLPCTAAKPNEQLPNGLFPIHMLELPEGAMEFLLSSKEAELHNSSATSSASVRSSGQVTHESSTPDLDDSYKVATSFPPSKPPPAERIRDVSAALETGAPNQPTTTPVAPLVPSKVPENNLQRFAQNSVPQPPAFSRPCAATQDDAGVIGVDRRALNMTTLTVTPTHSTVSTNSNNTGIVYVCPLLRAPPLCASLAHTALPQSLPPVTSLVANNKGSKTITGAQTRNTSGGRNVCESVLVLTPAGRVELVVPEADRSTTPATSPSSFSAPFTLTSPVTLRDVKYSLWSSAVGQLLQLGEDAEVRWVYTPGGSGLMDTEEITKKHVVLRLMRHTNSQ